MQHHSLGRLLGSAVVATGLSVLLIPSPLQSQPSSISDMERTICNEMRAKGITVAVPNSTNTIFYHQNLMGDLGRYDLQCNVSSDRIVQFFTLIWYGFETTGRSLRTFMDFDREGVDGNFDLPARNVLTPQELVNETQIFRDTMDDVFTHYILAK